MTVDRYHYELTPAARTPDRHVNPARIGSLTLVHQNDDDDELNPLFSRPAASTDPLLFLKCLKHNRE